MESQIVSDTYDAEFPPISIDTVVRKERWQSRNNMKPRKPVRKQVKVSPSVPQQISANMESTSNCDTIVVGTSHVRGLGLALNTRGINSVCYTNPGCSLKHITPRIKHMVPRGFTGRVVLQVGGNDLSNICSESTITQYDHLLAKLYEHAPSCQIYICAIPPRRCNSFNYKKGVVNEYLQLTCYLTQNLFFIDCPDYELRHFKRDGVHLNHYGFIMYVENLSSSLKRDFRLTKLTGHLK